MKGDDVVRTRLDWMPRESEKQVVSHLSGMPRQCLGSDRSRDQVISPTRRRS